MLESLKDIKTLQDIKVQKERYRYEALYAEIKFMDSLRSIEQVVTIFSAVKKASAGFRYVFYAYLKFRDFLGRLFGGSEKKQKPQEEAEPIRY